MSLTPNEILDQEFSKSFRGYDKAEVDSFLEEVAQALSEVIKERNALKDELASCQAEVDGLKRQEDELREALISAKQICEEMKTQARKEADLIVEQAKVDAERIVVDAHQEAVQLEARIRGLRRLQREVIYKIRSTVEGYLRILDEEALPSEEFDQFLLETASEVRALQAETPEDLPDQREGEATDKGEESAEPAGGDDSQPPESEEKKKSPEGVDLDSLWPKEM